MLVSKTTFVASEDSLSVEPGKIQILEVVPHYTPTQSKAFGKCLTIRLRSSMEMLPSVLLVNSVAIRACMFLELKCSLPGKRPFRRPDLLGLGSLFRFLLGHLLLSLLHCLHFGQFLLSCSSSLDCFFLHHFT